MSAPSKSGGEPPLKRRTATVRVLLVEDDRIDRMAIERHVIREGLPFEMEFAQTGAEAVQKLRDRTFDLVLLDYMLGDMTGLELLPELRGVPAVFITGMGNEEIAVSALHQGAYDYVVKDPDRAYLRVLPVVIRNVLERRGAEDSLRESQRKLATLMRNLPGMAFRALPRPGLPLEFASAGCLELTGYREDELTAPDFGLSRLICAEDRAAHERALTGRAAEGGSYELTYRIQPRTGAPRWVLERGSAVPGAAEGEPALEGFLTDITERKSAEEQLLLAKDQALEAIRMKDRFVSLVAHDLRVPITNCSLTFQVLSEELGPAMTGRQRELFDALASTSESVLRMIDNLLLSSRLQSGTLRPRPRFLGAGTVRAAVLGLEQLAQQKGIALTVSLPSGMRIYADPDLLGEVLANLISNAIKYTRPQGSVEVICPGDGAALAVRDTGIGIDPARLAEVLRSDSNFSTSGTAGEKGTGLGLRICQDILTAHGGHLALESALGQGTRATVYLPQVHPRVLVAGLGAEDQALVKRTLFAFGATLEVLGPEASLLETVREFAPHLLVADAGTSGANLDAIAAVKLDGDLGHVPVLLLTSVPVRPSGPYAPEEVLAHPLEPGALLERLQRLLG